MKFIRDALGEATKSVLPIAAIVLILSVSLAPMNSGILVLFVFGTVLLILGMSLFTIGSGMSMQPLGEGIGVQINKSKKFLVSIVVCFILGMLITIAEPDLQVLAEQVPSIPNLALILSVAVGVGIFLVVSMVRTRKGVSLSKLLVIFYGIIMILAFFAPKDFIPTAFDSGGVTTGPITVPFVMALGAGMASIRSDKHSGEDSFGLVALCSIGPILSVLILSICYSPRPETTATVVGEYLTTKEAFQYIMGEMPVYGKEVLIAFLPIVAVFIIFQLIYRRFHKHQMLRISVGLIYTYIGLVLFLTGANAGFMPAGKLIGAEIAGGEHKYWLIAAGIVMGYFVVSAEPAVHTLKKQVEEYMKEKEASVKARLIENIKEINGVKVIKTVLPMPADVVKNIAFQLKGQFPENLLVVIGSVFESKPLLTVAISEDLVKNNGMNAGKLVREAAKLIQGGGGGQPHFATAGGKNAEGIIAATDKVVELAGL